MIKLSIIIPVYNCSNYLSDCLESICITKESIEIILIDDGSTDNSLEICYKYAKRDNRIKVFHKENGGVSSARNLGLKKAKGNYIMFVDADDILSSEWDKIISFMKNDDIYYFTNIDKNVSKEKLLEYICGTMEDKICLGGPISKTFKRNVIVEKKILFDETIINGEDMLFNIKMLFNSNSFEIINFCFYYYRQIVGQSTRKFDVKLIQSDIEFHKVLSQLLSDYNIDKIVSDRIKNFSLVNAVITILNRMSYTKCFNDVKSEFVFFEKNPYDVVISSFKISKLNSLLFFLLRKKKYRLIYNILKIKNKLSLYFKYKSRGQFIRV